MKEMTCRQLGGACDEIFRANSFDEMAALSKKHGVEMFEKSDMPHLDAMNKMRAMMHEAGAMEKWMEEKKALFDSLPEIQV